MILFQQRIKRPGELTEIERLGLEHTAVDQKTWRAGEIQTLGSVLIGLNDRSGLVIVDARIELGSIETQVGGVVF